MKKNLIVEKIEQSYELEQSEIGHCVELYYDAQSLRIRHANKERTEQRGVLSQWLAEWLGQGEKQIYNKLHQWVESDRPSPEAKWAYSQVGIGPVIAAGLSAYIDVARSRTISSLWRFAGLAPGFDRRVRGEKLPYNARLKVLCWKMGESFVKVSGKEGATYGHIYARFKAHEIDKNASGRYANAAQAELQKKSFKRENVTKKKLESGQLSDAHLHARAMRKAVKQFLSDYWVVGRKARGLPVTLPYAFEVLHHSKEHYEPPIEPAGESQPDVAA